MPQTIPKAAKGDRAPVYRASRLGTMRFSVVEMPAFTSSASAKGSAMANRRFCSWIGGPMGACYLCRNDIKQTRVKQALTPLPKIMAWHAFAGLLPAQNVKAKMVTPMAQNCSATSTATNVPIRLAAVKYPVITPQRQTTGIMAQYRRMEVTVSGFPIHKEDIMGARTYKTVLMLRLMIML